MKCGRKRRWREMRMGEKGKRENKMEGDEKEKKRKDKKMEK